MRVLLLNETARAHLGGTNRVVVETLGLLEAAGHAVALAFFDGGTSEVRCPVYPLAITGRAENRQAALRRVVAEFKPDLAQAHWLEQPELAAEIADLVPTCRFIHDQALFCSGGNRMARDYSPCHRPHSPACLLWHYLEGCGGKNPLGNWRRWRRLRVHQALRTHPRVRFQVASEFMRRGLAENGYPLDRIDLVPLYALAPRVKAETERGQLLVASRLARGKGIDLLVRALDGIRGAPWRLTVAGEGPQRVGLEAMTRGLGLADRVSFIGELSPTNLDAWYARSEIVVHPTVRPEPFGLVGPEAMAHGKPVVAFAGGATEEWLADGQTGLVVRQRSPAALGEAIATLLSEPARCRALGEHARLQWERFRPETYLARLVESFDRARQQAPS